MPFTPVHPATTFSPRGWATPAAYPSPCPSACSGWHFWRSDSMVLTVDRCVRERYLDIWVVHLQPRAHEGVDVRQLDEVILADAGGRPHCGHPPVVGGRLAWGWPTKLLAVADAELIAGPIYVHVTTQFFQHQIKSYRHYLFYHRIAQFSLLIWLGGGKSCKPPAPRQASCRRFQPKRRASSLPLILSLLNKSGWWGRPSACQRSKGTRARVGLSLEEAMGG